MDEKKTVGILLRVSTSMQAKIADDEADIPTQRTACMRFIEKHPNWVYEKEYMVYFAHNVTNSPSDLLEKVELVIKMAFENPKLLRFRDCVPSNKEV